MLVANRYFTPTLVCAKLHPRKFTCGCAFAADAGNSISTSRVSPGSSDT